jgi:phage/plasmid-like protein (TIGR03299 family)
MAHNIWRDEQGMDHMFLHGAREDAWHSLGQRVDHAANWEEAMKLAGLDWQVIKVKNYARNPQGKVVETGSYTVFRNSDSAILGTVGQEYEVRQNKQHFEYVDSLLEANNGSHYDSAGALGNGETVWVAVRIPSADIEPVAGDKQQMYLLFGSSHDGSMAHTTKLTAVRVVCMNTFHAALHSQGAVWRVKHTKNAHARLDQAKKAMMGVTMDAKALETKLKNLAQRKLRRESLIEIVSRLFPAPKEENASTARRDGVLQEVLTLYAGNDNNAIPSIQGTAYNLFNAVTEYTDHYRGARITDSRKAAGMTVERARAENAVAGTGDKLKSHALAVIDEVTEEAEKRHETSGDALISPMDDAQFLKALGIKL